MQYHKDKDMNERTTFLYNKISSLIQTTREKVATTINLAMVYTYYEIGRYIIEYEQQGNERAQYGKSALKTLSIRLTENFGSGFSYPNIKRFRQFYLTYSERLNSVEPITENKIPEERYKVTPQALGTNFSLSWSHYLILMRIENLEERNFYEIECTKQHWSVRQLSRQVGSSLYERLALSRNKDEVLRLAQKGQTIEKPSDIIKNPLTLEFLDLKIESVYNESKLENAIINKLQDFLLELGKGFLFESRQKRFTFNEQHFFVDLVFYNRLLQCYVLLDLKVDKLTHQDLGQMQMYVNYFNRHVKQEFEKSTIGILLCQEKNDALVELTLPKDANIYATEYALYLPNKKILQTKLKEWIEEFKDNQEAIT